MSYLFKDLYDYQLRSTIDGVNFYFLIAEGVITMDFLTKYRNRDIVTFASKPVQGEYQGYSYDNTYISVLRWGDDNRIKAKSVKVKTMFCIDIVNALATHEACFVELYYDRYGNVNAVKVVESFNLSDSSKETK